MRTMWIVRGKSGGQCGERWPMFCTCSVYCFCHLKTGGGGRPFCCVDFGVGQSSTSCRAVAKPRNRYVRQASKSAGLKKLSLHSVACVGKKTSRCKNFSLQVWQKTFRVRAPRWKICIFVRHEQAGTCEAQNFTPQLGQWASSYLRRRGRIAGCFVSIVLLRIKGKVGYEKP